MPREPRPKAATPSPKARSPDVGDWRAQLLDRVRALILEADPEVIEERKWVKVTNPSGVPVFSREGIVCTGETYAKYVKLTFAQGASLPDPSRLFNASLEAGTRRAIDLPEGATLDAKAFKALVKAAVALNTSAKAASRASKASKVSKVSKVKSTKASAPRKRPGA